MYDLKDVYGETVRDPNFMSATKQAVLAEFKQRSLEAGYPPIVADFFLEVEGADRSEQALLKLFGKMRERWGQEGRWLTTTEAKADGSWQEMLQTAREVYDFE
ncbi:hypothetical protein EV586_102440 [Tumebacillus sp. BK434]|uniref:hypothetical protein n=1 Tax=Tumebacillus sp. BK434 TaxID=2512169 RepID=UPI001046FED7|nr:hypothetical protein [Tumebacillus sp. BK434]TCP57992.1 hypothetical protein EV586_102440 [Tumebacillus sp. BK434]